LRVAYTHRAAGDLRHIKAYIGQHNPGAALRTVRTIRDRIARLAARLRVGRPGRVAGTRELVVTGTPYIVAYAVADQRVEVLAIIHGAQRWPDTF
jgi:toxin ParE1/3/4